MKLDAFDKGFCAGMAVMAFMVIIMNLTSKKPECSKQELRPPAILFRPINNSDWCSYDGHNWWKARGGWCFTQEAPKD